MNQKFSQTLKGFPQRAKAQIVFGMVALLFFALTTDSHAVRIKDISSFEGIRDNYLVGYGLVVGLDDSGDDTETQFTRQSLISYLRRNNIQVEIDEVDFENVAAVIVTATLPPFMRQGSRIDVTVASVGDAESLQGGVLISTPLRSIVSPGNGPVIAVAQGAISTGGFQAGQGGTSSIVKNHTNVAIIPNGAIIEYEVQTAFATKSEINILLKNPDFTTARRIEQIINATIGSGIANARNSAVVSVRMPSGGTRERVRFIAAMELLEVSPDIPARVVYNERTGTIVMGRNVRISTVIITHGNLVFEREENISEFASTTTDSFGQVTSVEASNSNSSTRVTEERGEFKVLDEGVTIGEVAKALNALGVTARDIISILQALKASGALQAELIAM